MAVAIAGLQYTEHSFPAVSHDSKNEWCYSRWVIPTWSLLERFPTQTLARDLNERLRKSFPNLKPSSTEICLQNGRFPHCFDCAQFALGDRNAQSLIGKQTDYVLCALMQKYGLWSLDNTAMHENVGAARSPTIAVFAEQTSPNDGDGYLKVNHLAISHLDPDGRVPLKWASKFGNDFPVLWHEISDLDGGGYGRLVTVMVGDPSICGDPYWLPCCDTL